MSTPVPGGQPELTGQVMFYRRPEPLSLEKHRNLGVKQIAAAHSAGVDPHPHVPGRKS